MQGVAVKCVDILQNTGGEGGILGPRLKLKEIDGGPHKRRSMWLNSMQREEPYLDLTYTCKAYESRLPSRVVYRCCMAVVSSCREVFG